MIVKNLNDVAPQDVNMDGARDVKVRVIFGPADNAPNFAMRVFELDPGGHTPFHSHPFEHEAVILEGRIASVSSAGTAEHAVNDALLIFPGEEHQFRNLSENEPAKFMCLVPVAYQK